MMEQLSIDKLKKAETIAIIGCSSNEYRTSNHIARYLMEQGLRIIPINPNYDEVLGEKCYDNINDVPEDYSFGIVDIFRDSDYTADMVHDIIGYAEKTGNKPLVWTQLDVSSQEAKSMAEQAGLVYVENECIMVQHKKMSN